MAFLLLFSPLDVHVMEIEFIIGITGTPFALALLIVTISSWLKQEFEFKKKWVKVTVPWFVGIVLSIALFFAGKYLHFGTYSEFTFTEWKEWAAFGLVALMPGLIANGIFDVGVLQSLLIWLGIEKKKV